MSIAPSPQMRHLPTSIASQGRIGLTAAEAAKAIGISVRKLHDLTAPRGPIRCARAGRVRVYSPRELERFVDEQLETAG